MDTEVTIEQPLTLRGFCEAAFSKLSKSWPPSESALADEFISYFRFEKFVTLDCLQTLCQELGMAVCIEELPKGIRGYNHAFENKREILVGTTGPRATVLGSQEHTLLHELREQIEYEFRKGGHPVAGPYDQEDRAESFASLVRSFASMKGLEKLFGDISGIKSGWAQFGAILLMVIIFLGYSFACFALPQWEDNL
jgi:hypothetical protein